MLPSEYDALSDLYNATGGPRWTWYNTSGIESGIPWVFRSGANPCAEAWQGVKCILNETSNYWHVNTLELISHNLVGTLPDSISDLARLTSLSLGNNYLNGTIPEIIGTMKDLIILALGFNSLTGWLPASLGFLTELNTLFLYSNHLSGPLPESYGYLPSLRKLSLDTNRLTGSIPSSYTNLLLLEYVTLSDNYLHGPLSPAFGNMSNMNIFLLGGNAFTGPIPSTLGRLVKLQQLELDHNQFTSTLPASICQLPLLTLFAASDNKLTGTIPVEIGQLTQVTQLFLFGNHFTGSLPSSIGNMLAMQEFDFNRNFLSGTIPSTIGLQRNLQYLYLEYNCFTGEVPVALANATKLLEMYLQFNQLSGSLEGVFDPITQTALSIVQLGNNQFTGPLPQAPFQLPALNTFVAVSNCFTGSLPTIICNNTNLVSLVLDGLHSASSCRQSILPVLSGSYYATDKFNGPIPSCIFNMKNLSTLHISGNGLTGSLPNVRTISKRLVDLTISHNDITGTMPVIFQERVWKNLDISFNRIKGNLKSTFATKQFDFSFNLDHTVYNATDITSASSLYLQNNRLSGKVPGSILHVANISILGSNLFACLISKDDLPTHDSERRNYECGSDSFNLPFYVWMGLFALALAGVYVVIRNYSPQWLSNNVKNALECARKWNLPKDEMPRNFRYVGAMADILCKISVWSAILIVLVLVPWYSAATHYYGTYQDQYAWTVSAAFLAGYVPLGVQICVYVMLLLAVIVTLTYLITRYDKEEHYRPNRYALSRSTQIDITTIRKTTMSQRLVLYFAYVLVNLVIVVGVNVLFVYVALYQDNTLLVLAQISLSFFKLLWNSVCTPFLIRLIAEYISHTTSGNGFVSIQVIVSLFNNIAIPCLVVAVVSPSCFYSVFDAPPSVDSRFVYMSCEDFVISGCDLYSREIITTTYSPPFRYDFQCSSGILTYYTPAFMYLAIAAAFVTPVLKVVVHHLHKHASRGTYWFTVLDTVLPRIFKPIRSDLVSVDYTISAKDRAAQDDIHPELQRNILKPYFDANIYIITLMTYLGILLTFGVVFPPLALAMAVTMISVSWQGKLAVGRFLYQARELNAQKFVDIIEQECRGAVTIPKIRRSIFMINSYCCCFYSIFLFDTLGDAEGFEKSYWVFVTLPMFPLVLYIAHYIRKYLPLYFVVRPVSVDSKSTQHSNLEKQHSFNTEAGEINLSESNNPIVVQTMVAMDTEREDHVMSKGYDATSTI